MMPPAALHHHVDADGTAVPIASTVIPTSTRLMIWPVAATTMLC
jgi:hypothetical protein